MSEKETGKTQEALPETKSSVSRREFVAGAGALGVGAVIGGAVVKTFVLPEHVFAVEASEGYLLIDTKKCGGCESCMLACSMVHNGSTNISLSRIQIAQNPFAGFPKDMQPVQCRQCPYPRCVDVCPTGANHVDAANGNVRSVDEGKCIGCERCIDGCLFTPSRMQWNFEERHAQKCDLCANTPFWNTDGGPDGSQACVSICPHNAIAFTKDIPLQTDQGYDINMRNAHWGHIGLDTTD